MLNETSETTQQNHRARLRDFVEGAPFRYSVLAIIGFIAAILGLETSTTVMATAGGTLELLDNVILGNFVAELA